MSWMIVASWFMLAIVFVLLGRLCNSKLFVGIGAVMILMMAMVSDVSW